MLIVLALVAAVAIAHAMQEGWIGVQAGIAGLVVAAFLLVGGLFGGPGDGGLDEGDGGDGGD